MFFLFSDFAFFYYYIYTVVLTEKLDYFKTYLKHILPYVFKYFFFIEDFFQSKRKQ